MHIRKLLAGSAPVAAGVLTCHLLTALAAVAAFPAPGSAQIRLSEIHCAPTEDYDLDGEVDTKNDEFVEVHNVSDEPVSLEHWYLRDGTGDAYHYGFSGSLPVGGTLVVTGTMALVWQVDNGGGSSGLSLNNTGEVVELWYDDPEATPLLLDVVTVPPHAASAGRSLVLDLTIDDYVLHDGLAPYAGSALPLGNGCLPNPGIPGSCDVGVPSEARAWSALKVDFGG